MKVRLIRHKGEAIACELTAENDDDRKFILVLDQRGAAITGTEVTGAHISLILPGAREINDKLTYDEIIAVVQWMQAAIGSPDRYHVDEYFDGYERLQAIQKKLERRLI